ncbi:hypothetical protein QUF90_02080 [Desulfococcaceae bacterium HSG9]|nr:hypothetical protein [Desulfococcaceae bacterium HSG9]
MIATVIKIGGSIGQSHKLEHLMMRLSEFAGRYNIMIVPGGGALAE